MRPLLPEYPTVPGGSVTSTIELLDFKVGLGVYQVPFATQHKVVKSQRQGAGAI